MSRFEHEQESRFLYPPILDSNREPTGKRMRVYFERNTVRVTVMQTEITFSKTNRGQTFTDSREPKKRFDDEHIRSELVRMLGLEEGVTAYRRLL